MASAKQVWQYDNIDYIYDASDRRFSFDQPKSSIRSLNPTWLPHPFIGVNYLTPAQAKSDSTRKRKADDAKLPDLKGGGDTPATSEDDHELCSGEDWYPRHINQKYQLKFVAPLDDKTIQKIVDHTNELVPNSPRTNNVPTLDSENILAAAFKCAPLEYNDDGIQDETAMARAVGRIISAHHKVLSRALVEKHHPLPDDPHKSVDIFEVVSPPSANSRTINNTEILRTMCRARSSKSTDIVVEVLNSFRDINTASGAKVVAVKLRQKACRRVWLFELKKHLRIDDPVGTQNFLWKSCNRSIENAEEPSPAPGTETRSIMTKKRTVTTDTKETTTSQNGIITKSFKGMHRFEMETETVQKDSSPNPGQMDCLPNSRQLEFGNHSRKSRHGLSPFIQTVAEHMVDSGEFTADKHMIDFTQSVNAEIFKLVQDDLNDSVETHANSTYKYEKHIAQLWTEMVSYGTIFGFLGDWITETRLCIRIPVRNVLLISSPIQNPLVPMEGRRWGLESSTSIIENFTAAVIQKLENGDHPWAERFSPNLLKVMAGTTLAALRMLAGAKGVDWQQGEELFPASPKDAMKKWQEILDEWTQQVAAAETARSKALASLLPKLKNKHSAATQKTHNEDQDEDGSRGGDGGGGSREPKRRDMQDPPPPRQSGAPDPSTSTRNHPGNHPPGHGFNHDLHLAIIDGGLYKSDDVDVFHPCEAMHVVTHKPFYTSVKRSRSLSDGTSEASTDSWRYSTDPSSDFSHDFVPKDLADVPDFPGNHQTSGGSTEVISLVLVQHYSSDVDLDVWRGIAAFPGDSQPVEVSVKLAFSWRATRRLDAEYRTNDHLRSLTADKLPIQTVFGRYRCSYGGVNLLLLSLQPGSSAETLSSESLNAALPSIRRAIHQLHTHHVAHCNISLQNIFVHGEEVTLVNLDGSKTNAHAALRNEDLDELETLCN